MSAVSGLGRFPMSTPGALPSPPALPVVFLDLDDVLCMSSPFGGFDAIAVVEGRHVNPAAVLRKLFLPAAVEALRRVHDELSGAIRYVISSTWRESFTRSGLSDLFGRSGLGFVADSLAAGESWQTPVKFGRSRRVDEIAQWLDQQHRGEAFVIIDDTYSGASLMPALRTSATGESHPFGGRVVLCEENVGLTNAHVAFIVDALRRNLMTPEETT